MYTYLLDIALNEQARVPTWELVRDRLIPILRRNGATSVTLRRNVEDPDRLTLYSEWQREGGLRQLQDDQDLARVLEELRGLTGGSLQQRVQEQVSFEDLYHFPEQSYQAWELRFP